MNEPVEFEEMLSAYLDGELAPAEVVDVEAALESSAEARDTLVELERARALVRELPLLDPPPAVQRMFLSPTPLAPVPTAERSRRTRVRAIAVSAVATAAFWGVIVGANGFSAAVTPSIDTAVAAHSALLPGVDAAAGEPVSTAEADDMPMEMEPSGMTLVHVERRGEITHAMYTNGERDVSVFAEPGRIDWSRMPDGDRIEIDGAPAWHGAAEGYDIVVLERGRQVITIVAEAPDEMMDMGESMPVDDSQTAGDRLRGAADSLVRFFGLRG